MSGSLLDAPPPRGDARPLLAGVGAGALHAGAVLVTIVFGARVVAHGVPPTTASVIELELPAKKPAIALDPPEAPASETPPPRNEPVKRAREPRREAPAPEAARAGQVLTAADDVVDFGETFVSGTGKSYAGGVTQANGTAERAVRDTNARAGGVEGGLGKAAPADRSRAPALAGGVSWDCPFPIEADDAGVDHAVVALRVEVGAAGEVLRVTAASDPGNGFAREARRCAKNKRWVPGLDRNGSPAPAVAIVRVRFDR